MPRLTGASGRRPAHSHAFLAVAIGILLYFTALSIGGWYQGLLIDLEVPFITIVQNTIPYLIVPLGRRHDDDAWARRLRVLVAMNLSGVREGSGAGPTYFVEQGEMRLPGVALRRVAIVGAPRPPERPG